MARFNFFRKKETVNHEGAKAYTLTPELELYQLAATMMVDEKFYESAADQLTRLRRLAGLVDPAYVCRLAWYLRRRMNLRSVPVVLMVELLKLKTPAEFDRRMLGRVIASVIARADEITEFLAYYQLANLRTEGKKLGRLSSQLKAGVAAAFNRFDEYQFAKYNRPGEVKLRDALFLTHPRAKDEAQQKIFDRIASDTLKTPETWEVKLSSSGNTQENWAELILGGKLGYMALIRNLRNILQSGVSREVLDIAAARIADPAAVRASKLLPVRFLSAYRELTEVTGAGPMMEALEKAVLESLESVSILKSDDRVLVASDVSGSMQNAVTARSKVQYYDIGLLFSMLLNARLGSRVTTGIFGDRWKVKNLGKNDILKNTDFLRQIAGEVGYSTNAYKVLEWALYYREKFSRLMFFTDCQLYGEKSFEDLWKQYRRFKPGCRLYLFNLAGYGNSPVRLEDDGVVMISGWSDRVFDMLAAVDDGRSVVEEIQAIDLQAIA